MSGAEIIIMCAASQLEEGNYPIPRDNIQKQLSVDLYRRFTNRGFFAKLIGFGRSREETIKRYERELKLVPQEKVE